MTHPNCPAHYDAEHNHLVIEAMTISNAAVLGEARHWSTGRRSEPADLTSLADADLTPFVEQALAVGSLALTSAGGLQQGVSVHTLVTEAEERTAKASEAAVKQTELAVTRASETLTKATTDTAKQLTESIEGANRRLDHELTRLLGGEDPELARRLRPLLDKAMADHRIKMTADTEKLLDRVSRQFNPADPASPMAVQMRTLTDAQKEQSAALKQQQDALAAKLDGVITALQVKQAHEAVVSRTALKGASYEENVHPVLHDIAAGLGDQYTETGTVVGIKSRSKKGDGVLAVGAGEVRVVVEMTDSDRPKWSDYLQEAEQNRGAHASLGLVRFREQLGGQTLLTLGPRRLVLVFDPEVDDPALLRCALQLLRQAAAVAAAPGDTSELAKAEETLVEALEKLAALGRIKQSADRIRRGATAIETDAATLETELTRLLTKARAALGGAHEDASHEAA